MAILLALLAFCVTHLQVANDVTRFVPTGSGAKLTSLARQLIETELTRSMVLTVGGGSPADRLRAAAALADGLRDHPEVAWVRSGVDEAQVQSFFDLYFPRRFRFVSDRPESAIPPLLTDEALARRARALRAELALPSSPMTSRLAGRDPLGFFQRLLERFRDTQPDLRLEHGQFVTEDGQWAVVFVGTRSSPFDSAAQRPLLDAVDARFRALAQGVSPPLVLDMTGVNRFAVATENSIRSDMTRITVLSVLGVCGLFLLFFRSLHGLFLAMLPTFVGTLVAVDAGIVLFHPIHGVTLAFGISLVGIAIDYSIHLLNHHSLLPEPEGPRATLRRLRPSLLLGAITTIASFAGLALTSFPGIREIGIFASLGIGASLLATLGVLPGLMEGPSRRGRPGLGAATPIQRRTARLLARAVLALQGRRGALAWLPLGALALCAAGIPRLHWMDDPAGLTALDPALVAEDARVRARVSHVDPGRFVIALADDAETVLRRADQVVQRLQPLVARGDVGRVRSIHSLLWSRELQDRNRAALLADPTLPARLDAAFAAAGFRPGAFAAFDHDLCCEDPGPLTRDELDASPLGRAASSLLVRLESGELAAITYLERVRDPEQVAAAVAGLPGVSFFDQKAFIQELYSTFRSTGLRLIGIGVLCVFGVVLVRYRRLGPASAAFFPSLLAAATVLAIYGATGVRPNLLDVVSLVLVMGMGVDYGIFVVDSARDAEHLGTTLLSVLLSALTTVFVFGTLALSAHPALRSIGLTSSLGVLLSLVFAPTALVLTRLHPGAREAERDA